MVTCVGLYYPFIHFRDESWLKSTSLYWDRMGRIVPSDYQLRDSDTVQELSDGGYIANYHPSREQETSARAFRSLLSRHGERLAERYGTNLSANWPDDPSTVRSRAVHFGSPKLAYIFGPKVAPELIDDLVALGLAERGGRRDPRWIGMHPKLASVYMTVLAAAMATRRDAHPVSDDALSHIGVGDFSMNGLATALLNDDVEPLPPRPSEVEQLMAGLAMNIVVPEHLDRVPTEGLLRFRTKYADERAALQDRIQAMVRELDVDGIRDPDALRDHLQIQYEKLLKPQLADLKRRLHDAHFDTTTALVNIKTEVPAGLVGVGLMMLQTPKPLIGTGAVALGVWEVWRGQRATRRRLLDERPAAAYLYRVERHLRPKDLASRVGQLSRRFAPRQ
jgi:hypothetical protein